jgi:hypothetical protein
MTSKIESRTKMRDGSTAEDPRLGRLAQFDEQSRRYNVADHPDLATATLRSRSWGCSIYLDQGNTSACTGNSRTYDLAGQPVPVKIRGAYPDETFAQALYHLAQKYDEWPGENYEGSSVLGALKAAAKLGFIGEYRWAFNIDDMCLALSTLGPVVVGTTWYNSMFDPRPSGLLEISKDSGEAGGHAYYFRRILVSHTSKAEFLGRGERIRDEPLLVVRNSWGKSWGRAGEGAMWVSDYQNNLWDGGEQSVVTTPLKSS